MAEPPVNKKPLTRREFLELAVISAAAAGVAWVGRSLTRSPEKGPFQRIATFCGGCPTGCALIGVVAANRLISLEPNSAHPYGARRHCPHLGAALEETFSAKRLTAPLERRGGRWVETTWPAALRRLSHAFENLRPDQIAFVVGLIPDHVNDLVHLLAQALGGASVLRLDALSLGDGRLTWSDAIQRRYALSRWPYFAVEEADLLLTFGLDAEDPWLPPRVAERLLRPSSPNERPKHWVHLAAQRSEIARSADEWLPIPPGSEVLVATVLARAVRAEQGEAAPVKVQDCVALEQQCGVPHESLQRLGHLLAAARRPLAIPGATALAQPYGSTFAEALLALNEAGRASPEGSALRFSPPPPLYPYLPLRSASLAEANALVERMRAGQIRLLIVIGADPLAFLPPAFEAEHAWRQVPLRVCFTPTLTETAAAADLVLPDLPWTERWGYQRSLNADRPLLSALQPLHPPRLGLPAAGDTLLAAFGQARSTPAKALPFHSEHHFVRQAVATLPWSHGEDGWAKWIAQGGWWTEQPLLHPPYIHKSARHRSFFYPLELPTPDRFQVLFHWPLAMAKEASWWVAMHPQKAAELGLHNRQALRLISPHGALEAPLALRADLHPATLVLEQRPGGRRILRSELLAFVGHQENSAGDWALRVIETTIQAT